MSRDFSFGSLAWNEFYFGRNKDGKRPTSDRGKRFRATCQRLNTKKGSAEFDQALADDLLKHIENMQNERDEALRLFEESLIPIHCEWWNDQEELRRELLAEFEETLASLEFMPFGELTDWDLAQESQITEKRRHVA